MKHEDATVLPVVDFGDRIANRIGDRIREGIADRHADRLADRLRDPSAIWTPLREHGAMLLRGAAFSAAAFEAATAPFAERFRIHQDAARRGYNPADTTQSVAAGQDAIGLHAERAYLPDRPELLFFCCITPAASGGETTLCDGAAIVDRLSSEDVRALDAMTLTWRSTLDKARWGRLYHTDDQALMSTLFSASIAIHGEKSRTRYWFDDGETLHVEYRAPSLIAGRISGRKAFANYLLLAALEPAGPRATQADGSPVPADLLRRVADAAESLTIEIAWQRGDVVIIDNTRCLHGRRAFTGAASTREILTRMGDARLPVMV
jgi:alpha-ketoglutarate-dependent taurine dioxygenase